MVVFSKFLEDIDSIIEFYERTGKVPDSDDLRCVYTRARRGVWSKYCEGWRSMRRMALGDEVIENYYPRSGGRKKLNKTRLKDNI